MAQSSPVSTVLGIGLLGGAAWFVWNWISSSQGTAAAPLATSTTPPSPASTMTPAASQANSPVATTPPASTVAVVQAGSTLSIPANLTVTPDINNSLKGTVSWNGAPMTINIIPGNAGNTSGVVWNSNGQDITSLFSAAQVAQLVNAFNQASLITTPAPASAALPAQLPLNICMLLPQPWPASCSQAQSGTGVSGLGAPRRNYIPAGSPMIRATRNYVLTRDA